MSGFMANSGWWQAQADPRFQEEVESRSLRDSPLRFPFWTLVAFTLVMILAPQNYFPALKPFHLALLAGAFASGSYLMNRFAGTAGIVRRSPALTFAVLLFLWAVAMVPFSIWPGGSFEKIFNVFAKALIIFWLLGRVINSVPRLSTVAWMLSLISIPLSLSAVSAFLQGGFGNIDLTHGWERIIGYRAGLTGNPNDLALMINLTLPFSVGLLLSVRNQFARFALAGIALLGVVAVITTYSRGGFITLMVIIGTYLVCLRGRARRGLVMGVLALGLVSVPMIPSGYWSRLSTITNIQNDPTDSAQQRWSDMVDATHLIAAHPVIGAGAGMDILALNKVRGGHWKHVHNIYLAYAVALGLPWLLLFLLLYYQVLKSVRAAQRVAVGRSDNGRLYHISEGIWVALIAFAVSAFFHPVAYDFYFYYIAGLAIAAGAIAAAPYDQSGVERAGKT